ncbi:carbohydrate binding domain-containing protein [Bacillus cereus group sp. BcHK140]|uniref:carbohydrate binding domain-containing protein n=1 Tax=Bacillus cereus group sp. BcHK140 TaxID=3018092 RepID=UPI0022E344BD|nr:carbohydrate binding domain-containing protein [Bacillus cereus group sp. BcHK140]MDA1918288.1 carbohydrate binding domain-containing protein [Bacillus cereus group sp. BcHK140]
MPYANGQITILDLNDAILSGTAPKNPVDGTLWIDTSVNPNILYSWSSVSSKWIEQTLSIEGLDPNFNQEVENLKTFVAKASNDGIIQTSEKLNVKLLLVEITGDILAGTTLPTLATIDTAKGGQVYLARAEARAAGIPITHADYTAFETSYNDLKTYLESLSPRPWQTGDTTIVPATWTSKWDAYYDKLSKLAVTTSTYLANSIKPGEDYNGVTLTTDKGVVVLRGDNLFRTVLNATEGISIEKNNAGAWNKVFYTNTDGKIYANGLVISSDSTIAGSNAGTIKDNAAAGKAGIDDLSNDMKVTPAEKTILKREWEAIQAEYTQVSAQARAASINASTYTTAYTNLDGVTPKISAEVLANMTSTYVFVSATTRDAFRTKISTYFTESEKIKKAISDGINSVAKDANNKIDNLQIGGRNLLIENSNIRVLPPRNSGLPTDDSNYTTLPAEMVLGEEYTVSANVQFNTELTSNEISVYPYPKGSAIRVPIVNGRIVHTFKKESADVISVLLYAGKAGYTKGIGVTFTDIQIEKGNKTTAYRIAPEAIDKLISDADKKAQESKDVIADMTSDMKVTPLEKSQLSRDWEAIKAEYPQVVAVANSINVSASAYTTSYNNLNSVSPKIASEILANMNTTYSFVSAAARDLFKTQMNSYFTESEKIKKAINDAINNSANNANNKIDNLQVGGKNLLLGSNESYTRTDYLLKEYKLSEDWIIGQEYTFVIKGTVPNGQKFGVWQNGGSNNVGYATTTYVNGVTYVTFKAVEPKPNYTKLMSLYNYPNNTTTCDVEWVALYKGNKPMDWSPAPEDVVDKIDRINVGGSNLLRYSSTFKGWMGATINVNDFQGSNSITLQRTNFQSGNARAQTAQRNILLPKTVKGSNYSASAWLYVDSSVPLAGNGSDEVSVRFTKAVNEAQFDVKIANLATLTKDKWVYVSLPFELSEDTKDRAEFMLSLFQNGSVKMARPKLEEGNKPTSWTPNPSDIDEMITEADTKAQQAKDSISDMSSDSKITPIEKVQLKKEWAVMVAEKPQYEALANTFGITTEKTNFINAYNVLNNVLNGTGGYLINMQLTSPVNGAAFRAQFDDYYDKKSILIKKVNEAIQGNIDGLTINSRNLLLRTTDYVNIGTPPYWGWQAVTVLNEYYKGTKIVEAPSDWASMDYIFSTLGQRGVVKVGDEITMSVSARLVGDDTATRELKFYHDGNPASGKVVGVVTKDWKRFSITMKVVDTMLKDTYAARFEVYQINNTPIKLQTAEHTLNIGNKDSGWSPAPEDIDQSIATVRNSVDEMTSDMKITPLEKQTLRRDWDAIKYEYSQVLPQGQAIQSVSTTAYTTAYNNLNAVSPKIDSEILANMSTTYSFASTSARDTFRNQLNKYFDEAEKVKRAIAETTNDLNRELAQAISTGRMMYTDPIFKNGMNSIQVYNNTSGSAVTATRVAAPTDAPTTSSSVIEIKTTGAASPGHGGFQLPISSRAGAKFLLRIIAKIPVGCTLNLASNSMGTGYTDRLLTSNKGTGKFEEYIRLVTCGTTGTFSSGGHFNLTSGLTATPESPIVWQVAYATAYDVGDADYTVTDNKEKWDDAANNANNALKQGQVVVNSTFSNWTQAFPAGLASWSGSSVSKETTLTRTGSAMRFNVGADTTQVGAQITTGYFIPNLPNNKYYVVELDFMLVSGSITGACILLDWNGMSPSRTSIHLSDVEPSPALGKWYTVRAVMKRPTDTLTGYTGMAGYLLANYSGSTTNKIKNIVFDRLVFREPTQQEIDAYEITTIENGKTVIDGGKLKTNSVKAESVDARRLRVTNNSGTVTLEITDAGEVTVNGKVSINSRTDFAPGYDPSKNDGGRNILLNSRFATADATNWNNWGAPSVRQVEDITDLPGFDKAVKFTTTANNQGLTQTVPVVNGGTYTASCYAKSSSGQPHLQVYDGSGYPSTPMPSSAVGKNSWVKMSFVFVAKSNNIQIQIGKAGGGSLGTYWFTGIKLEEGDKTTGWTPANEDAEGLIGKVVTPNGDIKALDIASSMSVTPGAIDMVSRNINLKGKVTFSDFASGWALDSAGNKISNSNQPGYDPANPLYLDMDGNYRPLSDEKNFMSNLFTKDDTTGVTVIDGNYIKTGTIQAKYANFRDVQVYNDAGEQTFRIDTNGNLSTSGTSQSIGYESQKKGWKIDADGSAEFNAATFRGDIELGYYNAPTDSFVVTGGLLSSVGGTGKDLRFWAGANKSTAPFKVFSDGTLEATKGFFTGTFSGEVVVGNILIKDTATKGDAKIILTDDSKIQKVVLGESLVELNTKTTFGNFLTVDITNQKLDFGANDFGIDYKNNTIRMKSFSLKGTTALEFVSDGSSGDDFVFKNVTGDTSVRVDGSFIARDDIEITNVLRMKKSTDTGNKGIDYVFI